jgi:hypothetical protein
MGCELCLVKHAFVFLRGRFVEGGHSLEMRDSVSNDRQKVVLQPLQPAIYHLNKNSQRQETGRGAEIPPPRNCHYDGIPITVELPPVVWQGRTSLPKNLHTKIHFSGLP